MISDIPSALPHPSRLPSLTRMVHFFFTKDEATVMWLVACRQGSLVCCSPRGRKESDTTD